MNNRIILRWLAGILIGLSALPQVQANLLFEINVGTAASPNLREVNWGTRDGSTFGSWGVSSESFAGFTLTSLFNGSEGAALSYDSTTARTLGVSSLGNDNAINYRTNNPQGLEAIRLDLPPLGAVVGAQSDSALTFNGITGIALDRLNNGTGNIVTISGFAADPQAAWVVSPFTTAPTLIYDAGLAQLRFETQNETDWNGFGLLSFANPNATLTSSGVSLVFSNQKANNNNSYGLVGWEYAAVPEISTQGLVAGLLLLGWGIGRRLIARPKP